MFAIISHQLYILIPLTAVQSILAAYEGLLICLQLFRPTLLYCPFIWGQESLFLLVFLLNF